MKPSFHAAALTVSGVWRGREEVSSVLLVLHEGRGRNARRQLLHPGDDVAADGSWTARVSSAVSGVWAVPYDGLADPDILLRMSPRTLDKRCVGKVRLLAPKRRRATATADEGELKAILDLPPVPFPALPDPSLLSAYREYCAYLGLDLDTELHRLAQNDLDRAREHYKRKRKHVRVGEIIQARVNSREAVRAYFHLCKTLLNSVTIDAGNFVERASAWMSLTSKRPGTPINEFFKLFLQIAGLIAKFVEQGAGKTVIDTALSVTTIFQTTVSLVDGNRSAYPNLDKVHLAKAELLGALTDWKRATEAKVDDMQALFLRDAAKLERGGRLVFPEKTAPILDASARSWGRIIWLKLLPMRTVLVKDGGETYERKKFNNDEKRVQAYLEEKVQSAWKGKSAGDLRTVTYGYFKDCVGRKRRKYYYRIPRWTLRLGASAETDFDLDAARSLRACAITPRELILGLKLPILCFSGTPGIPPKTGANLWTDVYWVGIHGRRHYMNIAQWDPVGRKGKG